MMLLTSNKLHQRTIEEWTQWCHYIIFIALDYHDNENILYIYFIHHCFIYRPPLCRRQPISNPGCCDQRERHGSTRVTRPCLPCVTQFMTVFFAHLVIDQPRISPRPGQMVWSVRAGGMVRPSRTKSDTIGSLPSSQPGGSPGGVSPLVVGLIGCDHGIKKLIWNGHGYRQSH